MKDRLITNGVLGTVQALSFWIIFIITFKSHVFFPQTIAFEVIFGFLFFGIGIAKLVMGIVTLAMEKSDNARGLTIASGVLSIIPFVGLTFALSVVSFIGATKAY